MNNLQNCLLGSNSIGEKVVLCLKKLNFQVRSDDVSQDDFVDLDVLAEVLQRDFSSLEEKLEVVIEVFRLLRNFATKSTEAQRKIIENKCLFRQLLTFIREWSALLPNEDVLLCLHCGLQFLGNLVVNNLANKTIVWKEVLPLFRKWLETEDSRIRNCSAMLFYNCIIDVIGHREQILADHLDGPFIVQLLLNCVLSDCEWGLFSLQVFLESKDFLESYYNALEPPLRLMLLDVLFDIISQQTCKTLPINSITFLCGVFETSSDDILVANKSHSQLQLLNPAEFHKILDILCTVSAVSTYQTTLQSRFSLLYSSFGLLKSLHLATKADPNYQSKNKSAEESSKVSNDRLDCGSENLLGISGSKDDGTQPVPGLKKNLIRLVANLVYRNRRNQDEIRELDGIPLLLDCCKLDDLNPFIIQWVIFAIRNLCEGNSENQQIIQRMELKSSFPESLMDDPRFVNLLHVDKKTSENQRKEKSISQSTRDDIRDLFL